MPVAAKAFISETFEDIFSLFSNLFLLTSRTLYESVTLEREEKSRWRAGRLLHGLLHQSHYRRKLLLWAALNEIPK